ncbi:MULTISPECIES: GNAT family N-acetyltransferase [Streptomyces]|uniref:GNAT family N-acetyltransferase n=1 Tax=Streptomyces TaxID=1883 RepID=UPI002B0558C9|nr:GNAT family N-acetyltransferase [Streptomyces sp. JHD 1]
MTIEVREFRPEDAPRVLHVRRTVLPFLVVREESLFWESTRAARRLSAQVFVAEVDGRVAGVTEARLLDATERPGQAFALPQVLPEYRGRGVGTALLDAAEAHLRSVGGSDVYLWALDDGRSPGLAERRGYARRRASRALRLDLTGPLPDPPPLPAGARLRTAAAYADDPRPLYEADVECARDEPGDVPLTDLSYENWRATYWERPEFDPELSSVLELDGAVAATASRTPTGPTGTPPA